MGGGSSGGGMSGVGGVGVSARPATPGGRGAPISFQRQPSTKRLLTIQWTFPVYKAPVTQPREGQTVARSAEAALPREDAFAQLAGDDRRPLLVLRECSACKGTDHALIHRQMNNDVTLLLTRFFHCVKLPTHVIEGNHAFRNLFTERPAHLFLSSADGSNYLALNGDQTQTELWKAMYDLLGREYELDAKSAVKELVKLLSVFDHVESRISEVRERLDLEIEKRGPDSPKVKELEQDLRDLREQKTKAERRRDELLDLKLRPRVALGPDAPRR